jgi:NRPS condensation-like uncharacterized protein
MKVKFKSGNSETKVFYKGILDYYRNKDKLQEAMSEMYINKDNSLEHMFSNSGFDFFKEMYGKIPSNIINYYKDVNKEFDKYFNKTNDESTQDNPDILPANGHEICNYVARYGLANFQIQAVMKFDGHLDFNKLSRAVRLSVDAQPIFGCRFIESDPPYWKRLNDIDNITFCSLEETGNSEEAVQRFIESPLDMDNDPMVKLKLIRAEQYDTLCVKINHTCCDAAGVKEYIQLLSGIYCSIDQENNAYLPKPRIGGRKDQERLFSTLGIKNPEAGWNPLLEIPKTMWTFPLKQSSMDAARFQVCRLSQEQLQLIYTFGKARGATVNDLILTAYYRAMFDISHSLYGVPMEIASTIDLRRYLPDQKTEAIRNLSGGFNTRIARVKDEPFEGTLSRVMHLMNKIKSGRPGLKNAMGAECVEKMNFPKIVAYFKGTSLVSDIASQYSASGSDMCFPGLSNVGFISKSLIKFGENVVTGAYIVPPAVRAPGFLILPCTYNGVLTLTIGYYKDSIRRKDVVGLLNKIKDELIDGCKQ